MGNQIADQYSLLHFCVGVIAYYWQFSLKDAFILHLIFEITENTPIGMKLINKFFVRKNGVGWPGGKDRADGFLNMIGDNIFFVVGWVTANQLDLIGNQRGWYQRHIE